MDSAVSRDTLPGAVRRAFLVCSIAALAVIGAAAVPAPSAAQPKNERPTVEDESVENRARPEYDQLGIRLGGFTFLPRVGVEERYNDNIFATERGTKDDFITVLTPQAVLRSNWSSHEVYAGMRGAFGFYKSFDDENYKDYTLDAGGRLDVMRDSFARGALSYAHLHEDRGSPDDVRGQEPITYDRLGFDGSYSHRFNRFVLRPEGRVARLSFDSVPTSTGTSISQSDRDRLEMEGALRGSYNFTEDFAVFARGAYRRTKYDDDRDRNGFNRNSKGYRAEAGVEFDITSVLHLEFGAGFLQAEYEDSRLDTVRGVAADMRAIWNITRLTTLKADLRRDVRPTTLRGASAQLDTGGSVGLDHELLRNLILSGKVGYLNSDFEAINRTDHIVSGELAGRYLLFQGASVTLSYRRDDRFSNQAGTSFDRNVGLIRFNYGL
jgi:hypothetical protein